MNMALRSKTNDKSIVISQGAFIIIWEEKISVGLLRKKSFSDTILFTAINDITGKCQILEEKFLGFSLEPGGRVALRNPLAVICSYIVLGITVIFSVFLTRLLSVRSLPSRKQK